MEVDESRVAIGSSERRHQRHAELQVTVFFFSSRRRHTRFDCDWSSDVCSSDLAPRRGRTVRRGGLLARRDRRDPRSGRRDRAIRGVPRAPTAARVAGGLEGGGGMTDRKSTRLNSSHSQISYAVFCLKTKTTQLLATGTLSRRSPPARPTAARSRLQPRPRSASRSAHIGRAPVRRLPVLLFTYRTAYQ